MAELKWFDRYSGQSTDELIALEGEYRTDSLVLAFEEALGQKEARGSSSDLTIEERVIVVIEELEREVNNGGYEQFFINNSNETVLAVDALTRIGRPKIAMLTQQAFDALGITGSVTVEAIDRALQENNDEREATLAACTDLYFDQAGDLSEPLLEFIKANRDQITLPG